MRWTVWIVVMSFLLLLMLLTGWGLFALGSTPNRHPVNKSNPVYPVNGISYPF